MLGNLTGKISIWTKRVSFKGNIFYASKAFKPKFSTRRAKLKIADKISVPFFKRYSLINNRLTLELLTSGGKLFISTPNALDEKDGSYSHVGLLNRSRARAFIKKYRRLIQEGFFTDNKMLLGGDPAKFIVKYPVSDFERKGRNLSHFHLVMSKK